MTKADLIEFRKVLESTEVKIRHALRRREGITVERTPDVSEEAQYAVDRELSTRALDRDSRLLTAVKLALESVGEGTYGICQRCEEEIGIKRLAAVPWTSYCIRCQEMVDNDQESTERPRWTSDDSAAALTAAR